MYQVDDRDTVNELHDLPQSSTGAPIPIVISGESHTYIAYYCQQIDPEWNGKSARVVGPNSTELITALVRFDAYAYYFGAPNDEAFSGHPLYARGLRPYGFFEVSESSWIRSLERMNAVHPQHDSIGFLSRYNHFVLSFHDTTFECIATGFALIDSLNCSVAAAARLALKLVENDS